VNNVPPTVTVLLALQDVRSGCVQLALTFCDEPLLVTVMLNVPIVGYIKLA
jgi:hypothetical protein